MKTGRDIALPVFAFARGGGLALVALLGIDGRADAATPTAPPHASTARTQDVAGPRPAAMQPAEPDPASRNVVARARMLECGHQWSNLKRAGTATGTWKEFSRGCLAQR